MRQSGGGSNVYGSDATKVKDDRPFASMKWGI
jgi:hypothetical protein